MRLEVYSDGSATSDDLPGGYGWVLVVDGVKVSEGSGHMPNASNNDAELEAAIQGLASAFRYVNSQFRAVSLEEMDQPLIFHNVTLVSDSQIILNWANGTWRFKQEDKIQKYNNLTKLMRLLSADTRWVKGHSGEIFNERCDRLANAARLQIEVTDGKQKRSKIGKKTKGVFLIKYNGITKIVDLVNEKCETYSEEHAPKEALAILADIKDE